MTFEVWDLILEQERLSNKEEHSLSLRNPWHEMTSTLLKTPWKVDHLGAIQWTLRRKTNSILISWGQRKNQMTSRQSSSELCLAPDNDKEKTFLSINRWTNLQIILGAMLFKDNSWSSALQQQLMSNAALERYFHIFILGYPVKHGYDSWQMLSGECFWMNIEHMHTTKIDYGTIYSEAQIRTSPHEYGI